MDACRSCGARLTPEAEWCWQCYAPLRKVAPTAPLAEAPWAGPLVRGLDRDPDPLPEARYSRWTASPTTFGPVVKVSITCALVGFGLLLFLGLRIVEGPMVIADVGVYSLGSGYILRRVWRRARVS
jgi:hypothetical protein